MQNKGEQFLIVGGKMYTALSFLFNDLSCLQEAKGFGHTDMSPSSTAT